MSPKEIRSFKDLDVWNAAMDLVIVRLWARGSAPRVRTIRIVGAGHERSSVSIPSNIAEGFARRSRAYRNHVPIALGPRGTGDTAPVGIQLGL